MVEKISNGSKISIDEGGASVKIYPGIITNNKEMDFTFDCGNDRAITYYIEYLIVIAIFGKSNLNCVLKGITNDTLDLSVSRK